MKQKKIFCNILIQFLLAIFFFKDTYFVCGEKLRAIQYFSLEDVNDTYHPDSNNPIRKTSFECFEVTLDRR